MVIIMFLNCGVYFFLYLRYSIFQYQFWAVFMTFLSFIFLFIGSGKEKKYQILVDQGEVNYLDRKKKTSIWQYGLFFYTQAVPIAFTALVMYYVSPKQGKINNNPSLKSDIDIILKIYYRKLADDGWDYRAQFTEVSLIITCSFLVIEAYMNKIKIRGYMYIWNIIFNSVYLAFTFIGEVGFHVPVYFDNLTWLCHKNISYLYKDNKG